MSRMCDHPRMFHHVGSDPVPPTSVVEQCPHNWFCPTCGNGAGVWPDPCDGNDR